MTPPLAGCGLVDLDDLPQSCLLVISKSSVTKGSGCLADPLSFSLAEIHAFGNLSKISTDAFVQRLCLANSTQASSQRFAHELCPQLSHALCRAIYGLVASQVGDYSNELTLTTGGTSTPAEFIRRSYGYKHDYLGEQNPLVSIFHI